MAARRGEGSAQPPRDPEDLEAHPGDRRVRALDQPARGREHLPDLQAGRRRSDMNILRLDSVVFETPDVARVRKFYVDVLGLRVGTYEKAGKTVADESETYFNLNIGATLLGFESGQTQTGTVVLAVK